MDSFNNRPDDTTGQSLTPQSTSPQKSLNVRPSSSEKLIESSGDGLADPFSLLDSLCNATAGTSFPGATSEGLRTFGQHRELTQGEVVADRYRVLSFIGRGGIGSVYKVEQIFLKKEFALKTLNPISTSDVVVRRFQKEAQALSKLDHQNLVRAVDFGLIDGDQPFFVMDFVDGQTLAQHLKKAGRLSVEEVARVFLPISFALSYAHGEGVIHRDIKPSNIVLVPADQEGGTPTAKIVDFGIAKLDGGGDSEVQALTKTGEVFGTPLYMSPEQCAGEKVDQRSDIYSLGCVMFEALTGAPPFRGESALETMMQHRTEVAADLTEASLGLEFPETIKKIVSRMLAKDPRHRYQNCHDLCQDLIWLQRGESKLIKSPERISVPDSQEQHPPPSGPLSAISQSPPRSQWSLIIAAIVINMAAGAGMTALMLGSQREISISQAPSQKAKGNDVSVLGMDMSSSLDTTTTVTTTTTADPSSNSDSAGLTKTALDIATPAEPPTSWFSKIEGKEKVFTFPNSIAIGNIMWWDSKHKLQNKLASGRIPTPLGAKLILVPTIDVIEANPYWLTHFQPDDISGVQIQVAKEFVGSPKNRLRSIQNIAQFESIRLVKLIRTELPEGMLEVIGKMPQLHYLVVDNCGVTAEKVAAMENLSRLKVLAANDITTEITPILKKLTRGGSLKRLSIGVAKIKPSDFDLIARLKSLEVLNVPFCVWSKGVAPSDSLRIIDDLAQLPGLEKLTVDASLAVALEPSAWKRLKGLKVLVIHTSNAGTHPRLRSELEKVLPDCKITIVDNRIEPMTGPDIVWFDPQAEDPAVADLW